MEFTVRMLVVIVILVIAFAVLVALIGKFGGNAGDMIKGVTDWFGKLFRGETTVTPGSGGLPGLGSGTESGTSSGTSGGTKDD